MQSKLTVFRALSALLARRFIRLATIIVLIVLASVFIVICLLALLLSHWWWLLLLPWGVLLIVFLSVYLIANLLTRALYPQALSQIATHQLEPFADKVQRLIEIRGLSLKLIAIISVKDLLIYHELRTIKQIIYDTKTLRDSFKTLEDSLTSL